MVVEHTFITTRESADALRAAAEFLQPHGFTAEMETAFQMEGGWRTLEMKRGQSKGITRRGIVDWPQQVRLEWDRGRVEVAASVSAPVRTRSWNLSTTGEATRVSKRENELMQGLLLTIATSVEAVVAGGNVAQAHATLNGYQQALQENETRRRRNTTIRWLVISAIIVLVVVLMIVIFINT